MGELKETRFNDLGDSEQYIAPLIHKKARNSSLAETWNSMEQGWLGILFAAGLYGGIVPIGFAITQGVPPTSGIVLLIFFAALVVGPIIGFVAGTFWSSIAIVIVGFLNGSLGGVMDRRTTVAVFGGLSGFMATCVMLISIQLQPLDAVIHNVVLVGMAMVMGQVGALFWAGRQEPWKRNPRRADGERRFQFQVWHMLVAMIWFGVIFALDRISDDHALIFLVGVYLMAQFVLVLIDRIFVFQRKYMAEPTP